MSDRTLPNLPYARRAALHALGIATAIIVLASGVVDCPLATFFHVPCFSCGSTRAAIALFRLDLRAAFAAHPVAPLVVVLLAALAVRWVAVVARHGSSSHLGARAGDRLLLGLLVASVGLEIGVWILRFFGLFGGPVPI
jgi:hypothetical protein